MPCGVRVNPRLALCWGFSTGSSKSGGSFKRMLLSKGLHEQHQNSTSFMGLSVGADFDFTRLLSLDRLIESPRSFAAAMGCPGSEPREDGRRLLDFRAGDSWTMSGSPDGIDRATLSASLCPLALDELLDSRAFDDEEDRRCRRLCRFSSLPLGTTSLPLGATSLLLDAEPPTSVKICNPSVAGP